MPLARELFRAMDWRGRELVLSGEFAARGTGLSPAEPAALHFFARTAEQSIRRWKPVPPQDAALCSDSKYISR
jgi:hypothetical protein